MYIIICETDINPGSMHETRCSGLVHWDDPEGMGRKVVGGFGTGVHMYTHDRFMSMYGKSNHKNYKVISFQLK